MYEILCKYKNQAWEHCDYAKDQNELAYLLTEYRLAYGLDFSFKTVKVKGE